MGDLRTLLELRQAYPLSWSSDGSWLLVASDLSGTRQLYRLSLEGGEPEQLTNYAEPVEGRLLPDDRLLLEIDEGGNERTQLYLEGDPLVVDPRFIHRSPHVSHDGSLLAYSTNRRNGLDFDIVVRQLESGAERTFELGGMCANGEFVTDEICDRFCVLGTAEQAKAKLQELQGIGVDQFNIYLMTHGQEEILEAFGDEIIPELAGTPT